MVAVASHTRAGRPPPRAGPKGSLALPGGSGSGDPRAGCDLRAGQPAGRARGAMRLGQTVPSQAMAPGASLTGLQGTSLN